MTNKEWLNTLSDYACALFCIDWLPLIGRDSTSSVQAISDWLGYEYNPDYHVIKNFNEMLRLYNLK